MAADRTVIKAMEGTVIKAMEGMMTGIAEAMMGTDMTTAMADIDMTIGRDLNDDR